MKKPSEPPNGTSLGDLIGLGERSYRKSYYPELQRRLYELERFKAFVDNSHDAIFLVELPSAAIVDVNDSACEQLGYPREALLGRPLHELSELAEALEQLASGEKAERLLASSTLHRADGSRYPAEFTLARIDFEETPHAVAVARDITRRRLAEEALAERANLAELGAEIGTALTLSQDIDEALQRCAESLVQRTGARLSRIWTMDRQNDEALALRAGAGTGSTPDLDARHRRLRLGEGLVGAIAAGRKPYFSDVLTPFPELTAAGLCACAAHPLLVGERLVGVVALFFASGTSDAVRGALASLADEIAVGVDRQRAEEALLESEIQRQRLETELELAARMQSYLLPTAAPKIPGFEIAASCLPAHQVGGDFYDWHETSPGLLTLTFGDVMGKGMAAAMLMATVKSALRAVSQATPPLAALHLAERALRPDLDRAESFVTLFHALLDTDRRTLSFTDCGHGHAFLLRNGGSIEELLPRGLPLGVFTGSFQEGRITFGSGDVLVLYSDGLIDALPAERQDKSVLAKTLDSADNAREMVDRLLATVVNDTELPLPDDLTVLIIRAL